MCVANECISVCRPTPLIPKALAAVLIARSALLGSNAVPRSVVKTRPEDSALERPRTKDVRRATSPFDAPVPVNAAGGIRELGPPRFFRRPRVAGTIGRRSAIGTADTDKEVPDLVDARTSWPLSSLPGWGERLLLAQLRAAGASWT